MLKKSKSGVNSSLPPIVNDLNLSELTHLVSLLATELKNLSDGTNLPDDARYRHGINGIGGIFILLHRCDNCLNGLGVGLSQMLISGDHIAAIKANALSKIRIGINALKKEFTPRPPTSEIGYPHLEGNRDWVRALPEDGLLAIQQGARELASVAHYDLTTRTSGFKTTSPPVLNQNDTSPDSPMTTKQITKNQKHKLTSDQITFLVILQKHGAWNEEHCVSGSEIMKLVGTSRDVTKKLATRLKTLGYIESRAGTNGGYWITSNGKRRVPKAEKSVPHQSAPKQS